MIDTLTDKQKEFYKEFIDFAKNNVEYQANEWDNNQTLPKDIIELCASKGYLGAIIPTEYGGKGWDFVTYGILNEAIGRASISLSGLLNVHTMVAQTLVKWGTELQKSLWLPKMARGESIGAFALTEPGAGSDIQSIETEYVLANGKIFLNGKKRWITMGGIADIFLVFGKLEGKPIVCIVDKNTSGLSITPIKGMLGFKASHLAILEFNNCEIDKDNIIGKPGFAFTHIAPYALELGRISVAFAALGLLRGCMDICGYHVLERKTFGERLIDHSTIRAMITDMGVDARAAALVCLDAVRAKDEHSSDATEKVMIAKYFTTRAAVRHATNAVQIMGALGCNENFSIARFYRDSKTMEIIEGSTQIHQMILGKSFARRAKNMNKKLGITNGQ